ncbi:hypothetical protein MBLNU459_g6717t1 [Dothideomycetes sp. NU459]
MSSQDQQPRGRGQGYRYGVTLRNAIKDLSSFACSGYVEEGEFFIWAAEAGVPIMRSYEQAPIDGALICVPADPEIPSGADSFGETFRWARRQSAVPFLGLDHKTGGLSRTGGADLRTDYLLSESNYRSNGTESQVYVLTWENVPRYRAILPRMVWERRSHTIHGLGSLLDSAPAWCHPFLVHEDRLADAFNSLVLAATTDSPYTNPTTGVVLTGWKPKTTLKPPIEPTASQFAASYHEIMTLWDMMERSGARESLDFNPYAPLVGDCILRVPDHDGGDLLELMVEFKKWPAIESAGDIATESGDRSVFAPARHWHLVIGYDAALESFVCIGRHEVDGAWADGARLRYGEYAPFVCAGLERLLERVRLVARPAVEAAGQVVERDWGEGKPGAGALTLVSSSLAGARKHELVDTGVGPESALEPALEFGAEDGAEGEDSRSGRWGHSRGLHWVARLLNEQCAARGHLVVLSLDLDHPMADHAVVDWDWSPQEQEAYGRDQQHLPVRAYSHELVGRTCALLRFEDLSGGGENWTGTAWPVCKRQSYWLKPACEQQFLILGSTLAEDLMAHRESLSTYLLMPSGFTAQFGEGLRDDPPESAHRDQGGHYFRYRYSGNKLEDHHYERDALAEPHFTRYRTARHRLTKKGGRKEFMSDAEVDPLRFLVNLADGTIYENLFELLRGEAASMSISNPQSPKPNKEFLKKDYLTTVTAVHQAAWDHGLTRYSIGEEPEDNVELEAQVAEASGRRRRNRRRSGHAKVSRPPTTHPVAPPNTKKGGGKRTHEEGQTTLSAYFQPSKASATKPVAGTGHDDSEGK